MILDLRVPATSMAIIGSYKMMLPNSLLFFKHSTHFHLSTICLSFSNYVHQPLLNQRSFHMFLGLNTITKFTITIVMCYINYTCSEKCEFTFQKWYTAYFDALHSTIHMLTHSTLTNYHSMIFGEFHCTCIYIYTPTFKYLYENISIPIYIYLHIYLYIHMHLFVYTYIYIYLYTYIYI